MEHTSPSTARHRVGTRRRQGRFTAGIVVLLALASSSSAGAGRAPDDADSSSSPSECPDGEQTLRIGTGTVPRSLDPFTNSGSASAGGTEITALYDTLLRYDPETGDYEPHMAESISSNDELVAWTVTLREGVVFSNGDPVTADAVKFSLERMADSGTQSGSMAAIISAVEVVDERTVTVQLEQPWGTFPYALAEELGMVLNPAVVEATDPDDYGLAPPLGAGAGPFVFESWAPGEALVLTANEQYWGGMPCVDALEFVAITDGDQARYDAYKAGQFDMAFFNTPQVLGDAEAAGERVYSVMSGLGTILMYNVGLEVDSPTHDLRVRQAIQYALDYEVLNDRVYAGAAEAGSSIMPESSPVYGGPGPEHDSGRAADLVEEVKAEGWDGSIELLGNNTPMNVELTIALEALLESVGMDVTVVTLPSADWLGRITNEQNFQVAVHGPVVFEETTVADAGYFESDSPANRGGYDDPAFDAAAEQMRAAVTREETRAAMEAMQAAWNEYLPASNLFMTPWWWTSSEDVHRIVWTRDVVPMFQDAVIG